MQAPLPGLKAVFLVGLISILTACGGGGGGSGSGGGGNTSQSDTTAPTATITSPGSGSSTEAKEITVEGTANDGSDIAGVRVNGVEATTGDGFATWSATVPLSVGANTLTVETGDAHGNTDPDAAQVSIERLLSLSLTPQATKTFNFSWDDVEDATEYRLLENPDGTSGYTQVATIAAAGATSYDHGAFLPARINASYIVQACNDEGCTDSAPAHVEGSLAAAVGYVKASNTEGEDNFGYSVALAADGNTLAVGAYLEDSNSTDIGGDQTNNLATNSGAVYVFTRHSGVWREQAYLKASNTEESDVFGKSVALAADGNTLAVGADLEDSSVTGIGGDQTNDLSANSGAVYVFTRDAGVWSQQAYVKASNTGAEDRFGSSVALAHDGNTLAVGAPWESSNATGINGDENNDLASQSGAVYVFTREAGVWTQEAYVKASNAEGSDNASPGDNFGHSVALAGDSNTLAVGAWGEDSNATGIDGDQTSNSDGFSGAVYVFTRGAGVWSQQAYVKASHTDYSAVFGDSVALAADGNTLAVGAPREDSNAVGIGGDQTNEGATDSGAVYVFTRDAGAWSQQAYVKASNAGSDDRFGDSVALAGDGNTLAVGAWREDSNATGVDGDQTNDVSSNTGAVFVFTRDAGAWSQQAYVKASNAGSDDRFGFSVALAGDGNTLAVGAFGEASNATGLDGDQTDNSASSSGAVYLY